MALLSPLPARSCRPSSFASFPSPSSPPHIHNLQASTLIQRRGCPALRAAAFHTVPSSCPDTSLYQVLQIPHTASPSEIKASYRRLARIYHPDVSNAGSANEDSTKIFVQINEAYDTLSDAQVRAQYDLRIALQDLEAQISSTRRSSTRIGRNWEYDQCW